MCVVGHGYGGLGGGRNGGVGGMYDKARKRVGNLSGDATAHPECEMIH